MGLGPEKALTAESQDLSGDWVPQTAKHNGGIAQTWQQPSGGITFARRSFLALPPSAKLVYVLLRHRQRMSRQDLISETFLPPRTVNYGLSRPKKLGLISEEQDSEDRRMTTYVLTGILV